MADFNQENLPTPEKAYLDEVQTRALISNMLLNFTEASRVIRGHIQSGNFVSGSTGWKIDAQGNLEANNGTFRGAITGSTITGSLIRTAESGSRIELEDKASVLGFPAQLTAYNLSDVAVGTIRGGADEMIFSGSTLFDSGTGVARGVGFEGPLGFVSLEVWEEILKTRNVQPIVDDSSDLGTSSLRWSVGYINNSALKDGITAPTTESGTAFIYVDSADGDLKVKFGDGTIKTIATDT